MRSSSLGNCKYHLRSSFWCFTAVRRLMTVFIPPPQSAVYLAGPQRAVHDSLPGQGVHPGDERGRAAPAVLIPGEGTRLLRR